ncbi:DNA-3-methyladenine glycosylase 2 family protein [Rhizobium sp. KVB221]|uniref:DNA-3-methyladenine glycosylase II n=1 Tax=Rhizobium setariae TaxID=2801340 RepID=A0A936YQ72_9HYPH|nr:DNA-3-methyladenine glycosylase 2 family protein [Rhizobium setariae]MBL0374698.1 DNA-3-methyladenine glycosylase 2 family protein [Rhizobium setariae]
MQPIRDGADIERAVADILRIDPEFARVIDHAGPIPLRHTQAGYRGLAAIIVSQMVSRASADAIWARLEELTGGVQPDVMLAHEVAALRGIGLSGAKEATLRRLAEACRDGLDLETTAYLTAEEAFSRLRAVKGIGPWTAEVYLLFAAGHPDVFPSGDVALQAAFAHAYGLEARPTEKEFRALANRWQPCRSIAARALWAYYARVLRRNGVPVA